VCTLSLARLYASRGVHDAQQLKTELALLLPPAGLKGIDAAAQLSADAIAKQLPMCIVADYDCDRRHRLCACLAWINPVGRSQVSFLVPDRVVDGYGLTADIAQRVHASGAKVLITVDNGIASVTGVEEAKRLGLQVLITDHHLPGPELPTPDALVNPNQPGCNFESKNMAGVGVMFYVLLALRAEMRQRGVFGKEPEPKLEERLACPWWPWARWPMLVALDANNRRFGGARLPAHTQRPSARRHGGLVQRSLHAMPSEPAVRISWVLRFGTRTLSMPPVACQDMTWALSAHAPTIPSWRGDWRYNSTPPTVDPRTQHGGRYARTSPDDCRVLDGQRRNSACVALCV
jgi:single-stranded DNA-specific DHH superfamily exonuclease